MCLNNILKLSLLSLVTSHMLYADDSTQKLDSVTVTANKIEENIQDVPQSITVIDEQMIEQKGIKSVDDIIKQIPNMYIDSSFGGAMNFRGLNTSFFTFNNPMVVYIDGIATSDTNSFNVSLENVERIEVLRGPQGTLYGKDAIGGVINIITKEPTNTPSGSIGVEYGSNNYMKGAFNLNTPIIKDKLFFNLNGEVNSDDGWITNTYNNDDKAAKESEKRFSTSLLYKANDNLSAKLVLKKDELKKYWGNYDRTTSAASLSQFSRSSAENANYDVFTLKKNDIDSQAINIKYEDDKYTIDSITTHKKSDLDTEFDLDFTSGTFYDGFNMVRDMEVDTYAQELRVSNNANDGELKWIGGVYFDDDEVTYDPYSLAVYNYVSTINSNTKAAFGQTMIPITDKSELTLGARYQRVSKDIDFDYYVSDTRSSGYNADKTWNTFLPKAALSYKLSEKFTPYVSISKGYMPGGFNTMASSTDPSVNTFEAQKSTNYEVGIKGLIEDFSFSATIFRMDIKDIQVYRQISGVYYTDNADKAHSQGIEFDFRYLPNDIWELNGAFGLIDTEYDSYDKGDYDFSGNKIEQTPSHTANLGLVYNDPSGFYTNVDIKNQGALYFYDDLQKKFLKNDDYTLVNVKTGYKFLDWDIYGYIKNLTDEEYLTFYQSNSTVSLATYGDPRSFGLGAKYKF